MVLSYDMPFGMIKIHSNDITIINVIGSVVNPATYINKFANVEYNVFLKDSLTFKADDTYRAMQMKKGIYLGHNIGTNCELCIGERNIYLYVQNKEV